MKREAEEASDAELIARVRAGETSALGALFDRHHRDVRRVIARLGVSAADVEDVLQATFLAVMRASTSYDGRASAKPWLIGLAVMHVRRHRRSLSRLAARFRAWAREPASQPTTPEEEATTHERVERTRRALDALSTKKREVIVLVTVEGLSGEEAAAILGVPVATVWTRLHHARRELEAAVFEEES
jgi:RNA polymerase sigma-70 factor (ECF subfamily)